MSFLGNIVRSVVNPVSLMQVAMGPAGWAALAARTIGAAIGQELIKAIGQKFGLPQGMIDLAQSGFAAATGTQGGARTISGAVGELVDRFGLSPFQQGQLTRAATNDMKDMFFKLQDAVKEAKEKSEARGKAGRSWLQAIADSLAVALDAKVKDMDTLAKSLDKQGSNRSVKSSTDLTVAGQEFSYLMSATSSVIKTIGEGLGAMARKQ